MGHQKEILDPSLSANLNRKGGHVYWLLSLKEHQNRRKNNQATWDENLRLLKNISNAISVYNTGYAFN